MHNESEPKITLEQIKSSQDKALEHAKTDETPESLAKIANAQTEVRTGDNVLPEVKNQFGADGMRTNLQERINALPDSDPNKTVYQAELNRIPSTPNKPLSPVAHERFDAFDDPITRELYLKELDKIKRGEYDLKIPEESVS